MTEDKKPHFCCSRVLNKSAVLCCLFLVLGLGYSRLNYLPSQPAPVKLNKSELFVSVRIGDYGKVKQLLDLGMDPNVRDDEFRTALYLATASGQEKIRLLLLEKGADDKVEDASGLERRLGTKLNKPMRAYLETLDKEKFTRAAQ